MPRWPLKAHPGIYGEIYTQKDFDLNLMGYRGLSDKRGEDTPREQRMLHE